MRAQAQAEAIKLIADSLSTDNAKEAAKLAIAREVLNSIIYEFFSFILIKILILLYVDLKIWMYGILKPVRTICLVAYY